MRKNIDKNLSKHLSGKHNQKFPNNVKRSAADRIGTPSEIVIQIIAEGTGDWIGNNVANKVTGAVSQSASGTVSSKTEDIKLNALAEIPSKGSISSEKRQKLSIK